MKRGKKSKADLESLADRLSESLGFVECAMVALEEAEKAWPAVLVLEHAVKNLREIHEDLDRASTGPP